MSEKQARQKSDSLRKKATIHRVTIMLATSKNVLFPGHNHLLTTGTDTQHFDYRPSASKVTRNMYVLSPRGPGEKWGP